MKLTLKQYRLLAGLSQNEAAKAIGVSNVTLNKWENGRSHPQPGNVEKLAELYSVDVAELIDVINKEKSWRKEQPINQLVDLLQSKSLNIEDQRKTLDSLMKQSIKDCFLKSSNE